MIGGIAAAWVMARLELTEHVRSKRVYIIGGLFLATFLLAAVLGAVFSEEITGLVGASDRTDPGQAVRSVLLFYFSLGLIGGFTFVSVLALVMSADRVCGEWKNRSLFLLLSKPLSRSAMLAGKIIGAFLSVALVFALVFTICLFILVVMLGFPDAESWGRIFGGLGLILAGLIPFVSLGILCSSLFRSPVTSFIVALGLWFLVFPLLGFLGVLIELFQGRIPGEEGSIAGYFALLSPNSLLQSSGMLWGGDDFRITQFGMLGVPQEILLVLLAMLVHTVLYLGLSFYVVNRRDYD